MPNDRLWPCNRLWGLTVDYRLTIAGISYRLLALINLSIRSAIDHSLFDSFHRFHWFELTIGPSGHSTSNRFRPTVHFWFDRMKFIGERIDWISFCQSFDPNIQLSAFILFFRIEVAEIRGNAMKAPSIVDCEKRWDWDIVRSMYLLYISIGISV